jgi:hypothetical protein
MWSRTARISYLSHADSSTSSETIAGHMADFLTRATTAGADLTAQGELTVVLFTAEDTLTGSASSIDSVVNALDHLAAAHVLPVYTQAKCHIAGPDDAIVVSTGAPPKVRLDPRDHLPYLLTRYAIYGAQNIRGYLATALATADESPTLEPTAYRAAMKAKSLNDRPLYVLLHTLVGYDAQEALKRWEW